MIVVLTLPLCPEQAVKHLLLHTVLSTDAENVLNPDAGNVQGELGHDDSAHECHSPVERSFAGSGSHIDGTLHSPDHHQTTSYAKHADGGIEHDLHAIAAEVSPQPSQQLSYAILTFGIM